MLRFGEALSTDAVGLDPIIPAGPLHLQFPGHVETDYLGITLSVRRRSDRSAQDQLAIRQLQTWLLIKALDFESQGIPFEKRIRTVSTDLRIAVDTDGRRNTRLEPLLRLVRPSDSLKGFEHRLLQNVEAGRHSPSDRVDQLEPTKAWWGNLLSSFHRLLDPNEKGLPLVTPASSRLSRAFQYETADDDPPSIAAATFPDDTGVIEVDLHREKARTPAGRDDDQSIDDGEYEEGDRLLKIALDPSDCASPLHAICKGTGLALKTQEGLNFLPFSYEHLRKDERSSLFALLGRELGSGTVSRALLAAVAWLAILTRRSMETVAALELRQGDRVRDSPLDWCLDISPGTLCRPAPRQASSWSPDPKSSAWIYPVKDTWSLRLSKALLFPLQVALAENPEARRLGELWRSEHTLARSFNSLCESTAGLERVSSGMISTIGELQTFEATGDATLSRMMHGPPRSGLPGSAAYPSGVWLDVDKALKSLSMGHVAGSADGGDKPHHNALGSRLNPLDEKLAAEFSDARGLVDAKPSDRAGQVRQHNRLVGYVTAVCLAATGARPVRSPFEALEDFNFEEELLYLEDKVQYSKGNGTAGRIVPMPQLMTKLVRDIYLPHWQTLVNSGIWNSTQERTVRVGGKNAKGFRQPISLPFLFLIDPQKLRPIEVSEESLSRLGLFKWDLPWNLFRHRMATRLRQIRLDSELIDAQLGHAELGATTFGDHSMRCFAQDLPVWREKLEEALLPLSIRLPSWTDAQTSALVNELVNAFGEQPTPTSASAMVFGRAARRQQRLKSHKLAREQAILEIEDFIGGRSPEHITATEWQTLGDSMLFTPNNTARTSATLRYETFERYLTSLWRDHGTRPQLRFWYTRPAPPRPAFFPGAVHARHQLKEVEQALDYAFRYFVPTRSSLQECTAISAIDLAVSSGVSDPSVLHALLEHKKHTFALTFLDMRAYLEYSDIGAIDAQKGLHRYRVSSRSAAILDTALSHSNSVRSEKAISDWARPIAMAAGCATDSLTYRQLIDEIARIVSNYNSVHLPGILAGALAGRTKTYSLDRSSWLRALKDHAYLPPSLASGRAEVLAPGFQTAPLDTEKLPELDLYRPVKARPRKAATELGISNDSRLAGLAQEAPKSGGQRKTGTGRGLAPDGAIKQLSQILKAFVTPSGKVGERKNTETRTRRDTRARLRALHDRPPPDTSSAAVMLTGWALHLLDRPYRSALLNASTVRTYISTLAGGFETFGPDRDLSDCDEEEITEFYRRVSDPAVLSALATPDGSQGGPYAGAETTSINALSSFQAIDDEFEASPTGSPIKNSTRAYVIARLHDFHQFAARQYGLADADWASLDTGFGGSPVSAGLITPREYAYALSLLCPDPETVPLEQLRVAFILLLVWRFGLRVGEAVLLERRSWVDAGGAIVLVVTGRHRQLKTPRSRRQIPLIGSLTELERSIVERWFMHWDSASLLHRSSRLPLFFDDSRPAHPIQTPVVRQQLLLVLKSVTMNEATTIHHARHAFACRIAAAFMSEPRWPQWEAFIRHPPCSREDLSKLLLGSIHSTRRSIWAHLRLLGHSGPETTLRSYLHLIWDWAMADTALKRPDRFGPVSRKLLGGPSDLDTWEKTSNYLELPALPVSAFAACTPGRCLRYFLMRSISASPGMAAQELRLDPKDVQRLEEGIAIADGRVLEKAVVGQGSSVIRASSFSKSFRLAGKLEAPAWSRLELLATQLEHARHQGAGISAIEQLSPARQILLWRRSHIDQFATFVSALGWTLGEELAIHTAGQINESWLAPLNAIRSASSSEVPIGSLDFLKGRGRVQVDRAVEFSRDGEHPHFRSRAAIVLGDKKRAVESNYELMLLWVVAHLSHA